MLSRMRWWISWSVTCAAISPPFCLVIIDSIMSIAAVPPAQVKRLRSISNSSWVTSMSANSSRKLSWFSQWIVHLRPASSPALAST